MDRRMLILALAALTAAQTSTLNEPCAVIADLAEDLGPNGSVLPAQAAYDCLNSVPVDVENDSKLIDELKNVWQFQSELVWYKNPGEDWPYGPLDVEGELEKIKSSLNSFPSEYAVQLAIQNITVRSGNFHWNYRPDILQVFSFQRRFGIASISSDGKALPKLYVSEDVASLGESSSDVADISQINGQKAYDYLKSNSYSQFIDYDGQLNDLFAKGDTGTIGGFAQQTKFDGNSTDLTYSNGKTDSILNVAITRYAADFSTITDGASFFQKFCTGGVSGIQSLGANTKTAMISPGALGPVPRITPGLYHRRNKRQTIPTSNPYPRAVVESESGVVAGYFLNGNGYGDVAVLKIISFSNPNTGDVSETTFTNEFQSTVQSFVSQCISENKQKLIIDLRENGGGATNLLLDTFMQLFPDHEPFSGQRYRATDSWTKIGGAVNEVRSNSGLARGFLDPDGNTMENSSFFRYWAWWQFTKADGENFSGWDQFNGPLDLNSDKFTATMRYNYSASNSISIQGNGFQFISGNRPNPFNASNVVMFTDALCGSSCASFHEELKNIAGVRAVTVGGLPENKPIQTITGTKGGEVIPIRFFPAYAQAVLNMTSQLDLASVKDTDNTLTGLANVPQIFTRVGDDSSRVQSQDQIRKGDRTATPLQFIYEASDCKIFYTAESFADPDAAWKQAWDAFQDDERCVEGSTKHPSSISGGFRPYGPGELKAEDQPDEPAAESGSGSGSGGSGSSDAGSVNVSVAFVAAAAVSVVMGLM